MDTVFAEETFDWVRRGFIVIKKLCKFCGWDFWGIYIRMPVMDGWAASVKMRVLERQDVRTIPIIAMTANVFADDRQKTVESGMNIWRYRLIFRSYISPWTDGYRWLSKNAAHACSSCISPGSSMGKCPAPSSMTVCFSHARRW